MLGKNRDYIILYISLISVTIFTWYLFFEYQIFKEIDKLLTTLIPTLALIVGIFQMIFCLRILLRKSLQKK